MRTMNLRVAAPEQSEPSASGVSGLWRRLTMFFAPLVLTPFVFGVVHSAINAGLAHFPRPEVTLTAYAVSRALVLMLENPVFAVRETFMGLGREGAGHRKLATMMLGVVAVVVVYMGFIAFSPLGRWLLTHVMGLSGAALTQATLALKVMVILPLVSGVRNIVQGMSVLLGRTGNILTANLVRLLAVIGFMVFVGPSTRLPGVVVGTIAFAGGIALEIVWVSLYNRRGIRRLLRRAVSPATEMPIFTVLHFFVPLTLTAVVNLSQEPLVEGALARYPNPETVIAGFAVAWGLAFSLYAPVGVLHQTSLLFTQEEVPESRTITFGFVVVVGALLSLVLASGGFTAIGPWVVLGVMGVPRDVAIHAMALLRWLCLLPVLGALREYHWGILMRAQRTKPIFVSKVAGLGFLTLTLLGAPLLHLHATMAAGLGLVGAEAVAVVLLVQISRLPLPSKGIRASNR